MELRKLYECTNEYMGKSIVLNGWIRNHRKQKDFGFIDFSDGSVFEHVQLVYDNSLSNFEDITKLHIGSSIQVKGQVTQSNGKQAFEIKVEQLELLGDCDSDYPLQPKKHSREFLREIAYLRPRANLFQAVFRIRSITAHAIHSYFQERNYIYLHAPLITASDCEGAGEMFQVTTLDLEKLKNEKGPINYKDDFFSKKASLTVSGQLQGETFALAFNKIYTFGPTFRAENSNTKTHASEFWMIEPEVSFCDLNGIMDVEEDMLRHVIQYVLDHAKSEMEFLDQFVEPGLLNKLQIVLDNKPARVTHKEAVDILLNSGRKFENMPTYDGDFAKEHEKYLTEEYFKAPVFIKDWPKDIKAFYMRLNDDLKTVAAVDLLVPGSGELMGGSQREERLDVLKKRMDELDMKQDGMEWYLNLRRYGGCVHSGFGMGFERLLIYLTGVENIRDVIPFPRTPGNCEF